jgi:hypothetical protein
MKAAWIFALGLAQQKLHTAHELLTIHPVDGRHIKRAFPSLCGCIPYWRSQREHILLVSLE